MEELMIMRKRGLYLLAFLAISVPYTQPVFAQIDPVSAVALAQIGKMTVGDVLGQFQQTAQNLAAMLNTDLNMDFGNAVTVYQSSVQGLLNSLDGERATIVENLDSQRQSALLDIYNMGNDLIEKKVPTAQAKLKVDVISTLNHIPLLVKSTPFMITSIDPTVLTDKPGGDYEITVLGIGIGSPEGKQIPTSVTVAFPDGPAMKITPEDIPDGIVFTIPRAAIATKFQPNSFYQLKITIASDVPDPCGLFHPIHCLIPANKHYEFDYVSRLFPQYAVAGSVSQAAVKTTTDPTTRTKAADAVVDVPGGSKDNWQNWATNVVIPDPGYQIVLIEPSAHVDNDYGTGGACNFALADSGAFVPKNMGGMAQITGKTNGPKCKMRWTVWEEKVITVPNLIPSYSLAFAPGESKTVLIQSDSVAASLNLTSATGNSQIDTFVPVGAVVVTRDFVTCGNSHDAGNGLTGYSCVAKGIDFY
jgi:hypothetical protein